MRLNLDYTYRMFTKYIQIPLCFDESKCKSMDETVQGTSALSA